MSMSKTWINNVIDLNTYSAALTNRRGSTDGETAAKTILNHDNTPGKGVHVTSLNNETPCKFDGGNWKGQEITGRTFLNQYGSVTSRRRRVNRAP